MQAQFIQALVQKGHCPQELKEMDKVELRDLYEDEFPSVIHVVGMYRNGGTTRNVIPLTAKEHSKKAA